MLKIKVYKVQNFHLENNPTFEKPFKSQMWSMNCYKFHSIGK